MNRTDELDPQSKASQTGMAAHSKGEEGSQGLSRKDEGGYNRKAKEEHPEAPGPVLGMNDERGGVSYLSLILSGCRGVEVKLTDV